MSTYLGSRLVFLISSLKEFLNQPISIISGSFITGIVVNNTILLIVCICLLFVLIPNFSLKVAAVVFLLIGSNQIFQANQLIDISKKETIEIDNFGVISEPPNEGLYSISLILNIENINGKVLAQSNIEGTFIHEDTVLVYGQIKSIDKSSFDDGYKRYLYSKGIVWFSKNLDIQFVSRGNTPYSQISLFRENMLKIINTNIPQPSSSLMSGITIGAKDKFSNEFKEDLKRTGTSHIVAVSGFNIALIFNLIMSFSGTFNRKKLLVFSAILIVFYFIIVGSYNIPALRATLMVLFMILMSLIGKRYLIFQALLLSSAIILISWPLYVTNVSFLLSVFATLGIFTLTPILTKFLIYYRINKFISEILATTIAATFATLPIIILFFNEVSLIAIPTNLIILPFIPFATIFSFITIILSIIGITPFALIGFYVIQKILELIMQIISLMGQIPFATNNLITINLAVFFLAFIVFIYADYKNYKHEHEHK
jgi:competence protein ComEC